MLLEWRESLNGIKNITTLITSVIMVYSLLRFKGFNRLKLLINKLFWTNRFEGKSKFLMFFSKITATIYLCFILWGLISYSIKLDSNGIISVLGFTVIFPVIYRIIIALQRMIYRI